MKLLTWNINHRSSRKHIPHIMSKSIESLSPDVIVLTEYVPGPSHDRFVTELGSAGFLYSNMSAFTPRENHIFIATRTSMSQGEIKGPPIARSVPSNVLHVFLENYGMSILGIRIPDFSKFPQLRHACWNWIEETANAIRKEPSIILGDFNTDPGYPPSRCGDRIENLIKAGWQHAVPESGVSYLTISDGSGKKLDHAFVSHHFIVQRAEYLWNSGAYIFAGNVPDAMSDHAILIVELEMKNDV